MSARHRVGRADSPRKPSIFLRIIGILGELCITASLVLGLFIFWQLYWSSWEVEGLRDQAIESFHAHLPPIVDKTGQMRTDAPPEFTPVAEGEMLGVLHMPQWGMQIPVVESTKTYLLDQAMAGHYTYTQQPGELGNFAVAAHRRTGGNNFRRIDILKPGDRFVMETKDAWLVYEMRSHEIVNPEQWQVTLPVPNQEGVNPTQRLMTMTTCHPEFGNSQRYIVHSELVYWMERDSGIPEELAHETPTRGPME